MEYRYNLRYLQNRLHLSESGLYAMIKGGRLKTIKGTRPAVVVLPELVLPGVEYFSVDGAAKKTGKTKRQIDWLVRKGTLEHIRIGTLIKIPGYSIDNYMRTIK